MNEVSHAMVSAVLFAASESAFNPLKQRERRAIVLRFGLEDGRPRLLEEIALEFKVSRESVRQIISKALRRMRVSAHTQMGATGECQTVIIGRRL